MDNEGQCQGIVRSDDVSSSFCFASHVSSTIVCLAMELVVVKTTLLNERSELLCHSSTNNTMQHHAIAKQNFHASIQSWRQPSR